ncbi:LPXTG cell wall anchor domain-containing protein [Dactylosporangium sp. CA-139066]|uniref:LPXTG cell wall anchor domain-containing protein n=1 Tax=Dactylosporangium sp. CA-139066 TaxID=3239930 RepID=UPI003D920C34
MLTHILARGAAATAAAATAVLLFGGTAAASATLPLHSAHRNTTAAGFSSHSCDQIPSALRGGSSDGFVFVLPGNDAKFVSLALSFRDTGGTTVAIAVPDSTDAYPDGITTNGTSKAWVVVPAGWTLLNGTAVVDNTATKAKDFNLTHTCVGTPASTSPSASVSPSTSPSASVSVSPGSSLSPSPSHSGTVEGSTAPPTDGPSTTPAVPPTNGGGLPVTGVAVTGMVASGAVLVAAGAALLTIRRRRLRPAFVADPGAGPDSE